MRIQHSLSDDDTDIVVTGDSGGDEPYRLVEIGDVEGDDVRWTIIPSKDMPVELNVTRDVARISWELNLDIRIVTPKIPRWKRFILQAEYGGKTARIEIRILKDLDGRVELGKYFQLADPGQWAGPKGERALSLMQAILEDYRWNMSNPLPSRALVRLVKEPKVDGSNASYFQHDAEGNPIIVLDVAHVNELTLTPPLAITDDDRKFALYFLHEVGHAIMSFQCGPHTIEQKHAWLTNMRKVTGALRSSIIGAPFSIIPGAIDWCYQLFNGLWGKDRYDFMSDWCRASGWVIDEPEKGLGWLGWKSEPPNIFLSGQIGKEFNLRNTKATNAQRNRLVFLDDRGFAAADKRLEQLQAQKPPNAVAIAAQQKVIAGLRTEADKLMKSGGFVSEYAASNPDEDWAECVSLPFSKGIKIPDAGRRKFLADRGLPTSASPAALDRWLGVIVRPITTLNSDNTTTYPPRIPKKRRSATASAMAEANEDADGDGGGEAQDLWQQCLEAVMECQAAVRSIAGETLESVMDTVRNAEAFEQWDSEFAGLRLAVTHGAGLQPVDSDRLVAETGDLLFCKGNAAYVVTAVDAKGLPLRLIGSHASFKGSLPEAFPVLDPKQVEFRWTPANERRVCIPTAEGEDPFDIPLNGWLLTALQWWGLDHVAVGRDEASIATGPAFARAWLKLCEQDVRLSTDPSQEQIEKELADIGSGLIDWKGDATALRPGDLVAMKKDQLFGVIVNVDQESACIEILIGGAAKKGAFDEAPGAARVLIVRDDLPIQWVWRSN